MADKKKKEAAATYKNNKTPSACKIKRAKISWDQYAQLESAQNKLADIMAGISTACFMLTPPEFARLIHDVA